MSAQPAWQPRILQAPIEAPPKKSEDRGTPRQAGTLVLAALAVTVPVSLAVWTWLSWLVADEQVSVWLGEAINGDLPRLVMVPKAKLTQLQYTAFTIASEHGATRWWTSMFASSAGLLAVIGALMRSGLPRSDRIAWAIAGSGLLLYAIDERFLLHERLSSFVPEDVASASGVAQPEALVLLIFPLATFALLGSLLKSLPTDRFGRALLLYAPALGLVAVTMQLAPIEVFERYPGWAIADLAVEFCGFQIAVLMAAAAWRWVANTIKRIPDEEEAF